MPVATLVPGRVNEDMLEASGRYVRDEDDEGKRGGGIRGCGCR